MKKYLNKSLVLVLVAAFLFSIIWLTISGIDLQLAFASGYTQDVFTHGYGGNAGHWSNDISAGGSGDFAYESDSMIEQLRESIEANDKQVCYI